MDEGLGSPRPFFLGRYGERELRFNAYGCTSVAQADRMGRYLLSCQQKGAILSTNAPDERRIRELANKFAFADSEAEAAQKKS